MSSSPSPSSSRFFLALTVQTEQTNKQTNSQKPAWQCLRDGRGGGGLTHRKPLPALLVMLFPLPPVPSRPSHGAGERQHAVPPVRRHDLRHGRAAEQQLPPLQRAMREWPWPALLPSGLRKARGARRLKRTCAQPQRVRRELFGLWCSSASRRAHRWSPSPECAQGCTRQGSSNLFVRRVGSEGRGLLVCMATLSREISF